MAHNRATDLRFISSCLSQYCSVVCKLNLCSRRSLRTPDSKHLGNRLCTTAQSLVKEQMHCEKTNTLTCAVHTSGNAQFQRGEVMNNSGWCFGYCTVFKKDFYRRYVRINGHWCTVATFSTNSSFVRKAFSVPVTNAAINMFVCSILNIFTLY